MSLPGADELFRTTGGTGLQPSPPRRTAESGDEAPRVPSPGGELDPAPDGPADATAARTAPAEHGGRGADQEAANGHRRPESRAVPEAAAAQPGGAARRRGGRGANRRPSGRERHDEKITVYVSAEELMDLEHARLVLRGEHGLAVDRGRIVREAVAVVLADLESRGDASILVRRLRGR
ncbi:hypothetical protein [Streptomyces sp. NPDC059080]|uniref:hypothetical protein n=1 Tax=Streptomyces sp. NPDC059080 TaxID=3346718 RepID=UPI0036C8210F